MPFSDNAMSFVKVRVVSGKIRTDSPTVLRIGMLLITTFVELRVVAGRTRTRAGGPHVVSGRSMIINTCKATSMLSPCRAPAVLCHSLENSLSERHSRGMACVKQTRLYYVNQTGKTQSKPLAARHGRGTAWARHGNGIVCAN
jgi:hypothetical protein